MFQKGQIVRAFNSNVKVLIKELYEDTCLVEYLDDHSTENVPYRSLVDPSPKPPFTRGKYSDNPSPVVRFH